MTSKEAGKHMNGIYRDMIKARATDFAKASQSAQRYAKKNGLKFRAGDPAIVYKTGSERVILISKTPSGIHMDVVCSPAYAFLDSFDSVIFA